jgi:hypothetical protein
MGLGGSPEVVGQGTLARTAVDSTTGISTLAELSKIEDLVENEQIREIVSRDIGELAEAIRFDLPKSILLLAGSILEGILVDVLDRNRGVASSFMKKRRFPEDASLQDLVAIAGDPSSIRSDTF